MGEHVARDCFPAMLDFIRRHGGERGGADGGAVGSRLIKTETLIKAPAERVWAEMTDFASFPDWNPFVREAQGRLEPGEQLKIRLRLDHGLKMTFTPAGDRRRARAASCAGSRRSGGPACSTSIAPSRSSPMTGACCSSCRRSAPAG